MVMMEYSQSLIRYPHTNNSLLSSGNTKKSTTYEPRTEAISPAINDDIINAEDSSSKSTKDEQTLLVEKLKKVEAEILQTDLQIVRLRRQKEQLEQAANSHNRDEDDQENVCDTKQLSIAKLVYHENRAKAQKSHAKLEFSCGPTRDLPIYNQPSDNNIYHQISAKYNLVFKPNLMTCFKSRLNNRLNLEESISKEYDRRMEKWLKSIEAEDSQPSKRIKDAKTREFFEKQFPELKKARESGERFSRVGQRVARSDAEVAELLDGITEREDQDKKVKSYAVIPPMLEEMRSPKPKYINNNGYVEDIIAEYKEYQILNTWTDEEKDIFRENYLQHPKDFGLIARMTSRKNVANCVQYYYLSKKSENYKQLLKRQQKRRTRSFVRPAQATPAHPNPAPSESIDTKASSPNNNDKQAGDKVATNDSKSTEQSDGSKPGAFLDQVSGNATDQAQSTELTVENSCCICGCRFSDTNIYRNVTRSNHQLYGIGRDALKPGMRICYPCRFRHVKHPSFDEPYNSPEPMDEDPEDLHISVAMDVDKPVIEEETKIFSENQVRNNSISIPTARAMSPLTQQQQQQPQAGPMTCDNPSDLNKGPKRTCVRDIIYQAIEMSFQKPKATEAMDVQQKPPEPIRTDAPMPSGIPMAPQHNLPPTSMMPIKQQIGQSHTFANRLQPPAPQQHVPMQTIPLEHQDQIRLQKQYMDYNYRQQLQVQQQAQQMRHMRQMRPQKPPQPINQPIPQPVPSSQLLPMMARYPSQPMPPNPMVQIPLRHMTPQPNHSMPSMTISPAPNHNLLTTTVSMPSPIIPANVGHQPGQKPLPQPLMPPMPGATATSHPLDFSKRYNESVYSPSQTLVPNSKSRPPPMAHSGKSAQSSRSGSIDDGVLNLSAKTAVTPPTINGNGNGNGTGNGNGNGNGNDKPLEEASKFVEETANVVDNRLKSTSDALKPANNTSKTSEEKPMQVDHGSQPPNVAPTFSPAVKAISPKLEPVESPKTETIKSPPSEVSSPKLDTAKSPKVAEVKPSLSPTPPAAKSPTRPAAESDLSRSPRFANSPTSPSEMVIDESADVGSPSSDSSPASDRQEEGSEKKAK